MNLLEFLDRHRPLYPDRRIPDAHVRVLESIADDLGLARPYPLELASEACLNLIRSSVATATQKDGSFKAVLDEEGGEGAWTIGWGSTGPDIQQDTVWNKEQADERLREHVRSVGTYVLNLLAGTPTRQNQFDAMTSFAAQIGFDTFSTSALLEKHRAGDYQGAAGEFAKWNRIGTKKRVRRWLVIRRAAEARLYRGEHINFDDAHR